MSEVMMPVGTQVPVPRRRALGQSKRGGGAPFTARSSIITRSMQKKRSLIPRRTIQTLPNISGLVVQAIASSESDSGLTLAELKEMLSARGYDVRRHSPRIQRKLHTLASKGALVRMTHGGGSRFFIVQKYQSKSSRISESPEKPAGVRKGQVKRRYITHSSTKKRNAAQQAKSSAGKMGDARKKKSKQQRRCTRRNGSVRRSQRLAQKAASSRSGDSSSKAEGRHCSSRRVAPPLKCTMNLRSRAASAEALKSASSKSTSERSRSSKGNSTASTKGVGNPYSKETANTKKTRFGRSRDVSTTKEQSPRVKAAFPPKRPKRSARRGRKWY